MRKNKARVKNSNNNKKINCSRTQKKKVKRVSKTRFRYDRFRMGGKKKREGTTAYERI